MDYQSFNKTESDKCRADRREKLEGGLHKTIGRIRVDIAYLDLVKIDDYLVIRKSSDPMFVRKCWVEVGVCT